MDKESLTGMSDFVTALAVLISSYWVFNLAFPRPSQNSLTFLSYFVVQLPGVALTQRVMKVCNAINASV